MFPKLVGALSLPVDKSVRRIPNANLTSPFHRHTVNAQAVVQPCSCSHYWRGFADDFEPEPAGREPFKIARVGEKLKNLSAR